MAPLRGQHRKTAQAFHAAEAGGALEDLQAIEEAGRPLVAAAEVDADHPAESRHLLRGDGMVGVLRQPRVVHGLDAAIPRQPLGHGHGTGVLTLHPHGQRLQPAPEQIRRLRVHDRADAPPHLFDSIDHRRRSDEHTGGDVGVAVEVLRRAVHHEIDAERQRLLIDGTGEGVVDHRGDAVRAARTRHRGDVDAAQRRIDRRLEPDQPRFLRQQLLRGRERVDPLEPHQHAQPGEDFRQQVERAAVDRGAAHHLVACRHERQERGRRRRLPARQQHGRVRPFERREGALHRTNRRILVARIEVLGGLALVVRAHLRGVVEHVGRRFVDRQRERLDVGERLGRALDQACGELRHERL